jgi:hypothetical protein
VEEIIGQNITFKGMCPYDLLPPIVPHLLIVPKIMNPPIDQSIESRALMIQSFTKTTLCWGPSVQHMDFFGGNFISKKY